MIKNNLKHAIVFSIYYGLLRYFVDYFDSGLFDFIRVIEFSSTMIFAAIYLGVMTKLDELP